MARHPGLRDVEDSGELGDVEALARQEAQQAHSRRVAEEPDEGGWSPHLIIKSTCMDIIASIVTCLDDDGL